MSSTFKDAGLKAKTVQIKQRGREGTPESKHELLNKLKVLQTLIWPCYV